ncbi:hypothetical protein [Microcoleus sp.]|uniref:hypothetical protein n=1 Tax=Microcoleus sp. TaxID=44472 RepID=UPI00403E91B8
MYLEVRSRTAQKSLFSIALFYINSGCAGMISNPRSEVGRKVESCGQQIIRAIFIFLPHSQQSTVNNHSGATGIDFIRVPRIR